MGSGPITGSQGLLDENQSANVITVCAVSDIPLRNDVNLQNVTREKGSNDIKDSLLSIPINYGQKEVINNCKSNIIEHPSTFNHLNLNLSNNVIFGDNALITSQVKSEVPVSIYNKDILLLDQRSNKNKAIVSQGLSMETKLQFTQCSRSLQLTQCSRSLQFTQCPRSLQLTQCSRPLQPTQRLWSLQQLQLLQSLQPLQGLSMALRT